MKRQSRLPRRVTTSGPSRTSGQHDPLHSRIDRMIRDESLNAPPKSAFLTRVWPALQGDYETLASLLKEYTDRHVRKHTGDEVPFKIDSRAKSLDSIQKTLQRREDHRVKEHIGPYANLGQIFEDMHDLAAIRIIVDYPSDVGSVNKIITHAFDRKKKPNVFSSERQSGQSWQPWFGAYKCYNHHVALKRDIESRLSPYVGVMFEVQVTSLPESLYNKLAHPLLYKKSSGPLDRKEEMVIDMAHGAALMFSICHMIMQDKLLGPGNHSNQDQALRDAMRQAVPPLGVEGSGGDVQPLVNMMPNKHNLPATKVPVETYLEALKTCPQDYNSTKDLWESITTRIEASITKTIGNAVYDATRIPIQLPSIHEARFDSIEVEDKPKCYKGTGVEIQSQIHSWIHDPAAETILWLYAPAGVGKSTVARTLATDLMNSSNIAAGYFFRRGDVDRNSAARLFPTLASQLAETLPACFSSALHKSLGNLPADAILKRSLHDQFKLLIAEPLGKVVRLIPKESARVIIIDALDECSDYDRIPRVVTLLNTLGELHTAVFRVFITSRPTSAVTKAFRALEGTAPHRTLAMHEGHRESTNHDIELFLTGELARIKDAYEIEIESWPEPEDVGFIVRQATTPSPLFIYAATFIRFIDDERRLKDPVARLKTWITQCDRTESQIDHLYVQIVEELVAGDDEARSTLSTILDSIVSLAKPLPGRALANLLHMQPHMMKSWLRNLRAVLHVPSHDRSPVEIVHKSFSDFWLRYRVSGTTLTRIDVFEMHSFLAKRCMERMMRQTDGLQKNICKLKKPTSAMTTGPLYIPRHMIPFEIVLEYIAPDLEYACVYWITHVLESKTQTIRDGVYEFLARHFLHWLEALSLVKKIPKGAAAIDELLGWVVGPRQADIHGLVHSGAQLQAPQPPSESRLIDFLKDAERFIFVYGLLIEEFPLQVYGAALIFSPLESTIRKLLFKQRLAFLRHVERGPSHWDSTLFALRHLWNLVAVAISPNGRTIMTVRKDIPEVEGWSQYFKTEIEGPSTWSIQAWDANTGIHLQEQCLSLSSGRLLGLSFFPDRKSVAVVSSSGELYTWEIETERVIKQCSLDIAIVMKQCSPDITGYHSMASICPGYSLVVTAVAKGRGDARTFEAPYGAYITDAVELVLWDFETGAHRLTLSNSESLHKEVAISPDGSMVASLELLESGRKINFWEVETGLRVKAFPVTEATICLAFSPDGVTIATMDVSLTLMKFWDATTGDTCCSFTTTLPDGFKGIKFFPGSHRVALVGHTSITVVDLETRFDSKKANPSSHPPTGEPQALSPDGHLLAISTPGDDLVLWDLESNTLQCQLLDALPLAPHSMVFSPDGNFFAAFSDNGSQELYLWDVSTHTLQWREKSPGVQGRVGCAFTPDGKQIVIFYDEKMLQLEVAAPTERREFAYRRTSDFVLDTEAHTIMESLRSCKTNEARAFLHRCLEWNSEWLVPIPRRGPTLLLRTQDRIVIDLVNDGFMVVDADLSKLDYI